MKKILLFLLIPFLGFSQDDTTSLPIVLEYFDIYEEDNSTTVEWKTASEINNSHFELYSNDELIKTIEANNFPSIYSTTFSSGRFNGQTYFILRQVDFDGNYEDFLNIYTFKKEEKYRIVDGMLFLDKKENILKFDYSGKLLATEFSDQSTLCNSCILLFDSGILKR